MRVKHKRNIRVIVFGLVVLLALILIRINLSDLSLNNSVQDFFTLTLSVLIEATPFVILGILLSIGVRFFIPDSWFFAFMPKNPVLRRVYLSLLGIFLPVCECGNVPLARGLVMKGLRPADSITFLLAAPILNPITIASTAIAFRGDWSIILGRIIGGFCIAQIVGWYFGTRQKEVLITDEFIGQCEHVHEGKRTRFQILKEEFREEANRMMLPLLGGAMIAGVIQVLVPRSILSSLGEHVVFGVLVMIVLAFIVSICASVDAFFALAFYSQFSAGALVAFLVFGPMIDIKMLSLMRSTFKPSVLLRMTVLVFLLSTLLGLVINYAF